jgi:Maltogenic Amylase, C-terminal domain
MRTTAIMYYGEEIGMENKNVLSYLRRYKNDAVLVVLNMSGTEQQVSFDLKPQGFSSQKATTLLTTDSQQAKEINPSQLPLKPFAVYIAAISK